MLRLLLLSAILFAAGCCSSAGVLPAPPLPVGRPQDRTQALRAGLSEDPISDETLDLLLLDRAEWRAWALALKEAGKWR